MSVWEAFQLSRDARRDSDECLGDICVLEIVWEPEVIPAPSKHVLRIGARLTRQLLGLKWSFHQKIVPFNPGLSVK